MTSESVQKQYDLITRNLSEVLGEKQLKERLQQAEETGKPLSLYWGVY